MELVYVRTAVMFATHQSELDIMLDLTFLLQMDEQDERIHKIH